MGPFFFVLSYLNRDKEKLHSEREYENMSLNLSIDTSTNDETSQLFL